MLERFEIGSKYQILEWSEMEKLEGVINYPHKLVYNGVCFLTEMKEYCGHQFIANNIDIFFGLRNTYRCVFPWMCKRVHSREEIERPSSMKYEKHNEICKELNKIYKNKNHDYGDSFGETYKKLGIISAITRITDKVNRLQSLAIKEQKVKDESINDTLKDLANYAIMTLIEMEDK